MIYREGGPGEARALYLDNEGHVIHYRAGIDSASGTVTLVSDPDPAAPRYRFVYTPLGRDRVEFNFDIAPPGKPDSLATYVRGTARRRPAR